MHRVWADLASKRMQVFKFVHFLCLVLRHVPAAARVSLQASAETLHASQNMHAVWINSVHYTYSLLDAAIGFCNALVHVLKAA